MDSLSEGDDDPEPEVFVDPLAIAAARQAQLLKSQVKEVQALIHVLVMAAQGHGAFSATDKTGDIFDELIQETNKSAAKTFFERGTNTSSKLTGCLISASDESHAQLLISTAPKHNLVAIKVSDIRTSTNSRFLSFLQGVNNLSISSDCFPHDHVFNYNESTHREAFAWTFLTFFSLYLPLRNPSLQGLEFRIMSTSLTKATRRMAASHSISRSIIGIVVTFEARTTMNPAWNIELSSIPQYIPPNTIPSTFAYEDGADDTKVLQARATHHKPIALAPTCPSPHEKPTPTHRPKRATLINTMRHNTTIPFH